MFDKSFLETKLSLKPEPERKGAQKERVHKTKMTIDTNYKDIFHKMTKLDRPGHHGHRRRAHKTHITMNAMEKRATQTKVI